MRASVADPLAPQIAAPLRHIPTAGRVLASANPACNPIIIATLPHLHQAAEYLRQLPAGTPIMVRREGVFLGGCDASFFVCVDGHTNPFDKVWKGSRTKLPYPDFRKVVPRLGFLCPQNRPLFCCCFLVVCPMNSPRLSETETGEPTTVRVLLRFPGNGGEGTNHYFFFLDPAIQLCSSECRLSQPKEPRKIPQSQPSTHGMLNDRFMGDYPGKKYSEARSISLFVFPWC